MRNEFFHGVGVEIETADLADHVDLVKRRNLENCNLRFVTSFEKKWLVAGQNSIDPDRTRLLNYSVLRLFYWLASGALLLITFFTLRYLYKTAVYVTILSVNWVYQLTGYKLSTMKWSNKGNV